MKRICFIANYYKTDVFIEISKRLKDYSISSYWIIPNRKQYNLLQSIFPEECLLYVGKDIVLESDAKAIDVDLTLNELIIGDRVLRYESKKWTFKYLHKLKNLYFEFLSRNQIDYIFGEITWAHELVAHRLTTRMKELNCVFLNPHTIRIPNGRFAFFVDEFQSKIEEIVNSPSSAGNNIEVEKPDYLALNNKHLSDKGKLNGNIKLIKNFMFRTNQDSNDPTLYSSPITQLRIRGMELYNRLVFRNFITEINIDDLPNKKKILFTLHKQPEASIDVIGRYYENQLELIKNIWRILPEDYILVVKEHSNAIGDRGYDFYKQIKGLKGVFLVDNKADSYLLLDLCDAVFTVSGTIGYEAPLKGKKSFTFAPTFFNKLNGCVEISWKDFKYSSLEALIQNNSLGLDVEPFSNWLISNSFEGIMSDSFGDPRCMVRENLDVLSEAFLKVISK